MAQDVIERDQLTVLLRGAPPDVRRCAIVEESPAEPAPLDLSHVADETVKRQRGRTHGHDVEDWFRAIAEVSTRAHHSA